MSREDGFAVPDQSRLLKFFSAVKYGQNTVILAYRKELIECRINNDIMNIYIILYNKSFNNNRKSAVSAARFNDVFARKKVPRDGDVRRHGNILSKLDFDFFFFF